MVEASRHECPPNGLQLTQQLFERRHFAFITTCASHTGASVKLRLRPTRQPVSDAYRHLFRHM